MATFRVTGPVLDSTRRKGTAKGSGNPYDFTVITVLVGGRGTCELTLPDDPSVIGGQIPQRMETVDFVVEVSPRATGFGINILGLYSKDALADLASVA
jgi:hypothetical protein